MVKCKSCWQKKIIFLYLKLKMMQKKEGIWRMCLLSLLWWCDEHPALVEGWGQLRDLQGLAPEPPSQGTP